MSHLSPDRINLHADCERCFWLRVTEGLDRPERGFPSVVGELDRVTRAHFDSYRGDGSLPPGLRGVDGRLVDDEELLERCRNWRSGPAWTDPDSGVTLRGAMDDLLRLATGDLAVLDYKTRASPPDEVHENYRRQLSLYALLLAENGHDVAPFGLLLYYLPDRVAPAGEFVFGTHLERVPVDLSWARELVREAAATMEGPEPPPDEDCEFCAWADEVGGRG